MKKILVAVTLLFAGSLWAVTLEDIEKQAATVKTEQAKLDSLKSLYRAEQISAKGLAAGVKVLKATAAKETGLVDPDYVDIDIPFSTWSAVEQAEWKAALAEARLKATYISVGRYRVHNAHVARFLALAEPTVSEE